MCLAKQQYKQSDEAKAKGQAYEQMDDRYKRWTEEDLQRTGQMDQINKQVAAKEAEFNQAKEAQMRRMGWRPQAEIDAARQQQQQSAASGLRLGTGRSGTLGQQGNLARAARSNVKANPMLSMIQSQKFNADQMRRDLMREAALKRVESGVYSRTNITADTPSQQVSVIGGASSRASSGSTSGVSRGGTGSNPRTGPTGVKLNIGT